MKEKEESRRNFKGFNIPARYIGSWNFEKNEVFMKPSTDRIEGLHEKFEGNSEWELCAILAFPETQYDVEQMPTFIMTTLTICGIFTPFSNTSERREKILRPYEDGDMSGFP
ncbi:hypothetical protein TELCIR_04817 [Teladorsagia circumcincta]|uniref:Uncharacterized protein n=1 Tax=Teladorsagia circumcincta TaxID=45464 RepID=A0A2G9UST3_TELCI|nr:hypothetical protein TELCIR_04817 [Teladorsagia circumcincta]